MKPPIVEKIKKLLRLARDSDGHEAALAGRRAKFLMWRHRVSVSLYDVVRHSMPDVASVVWRELLVSLIAREHDCRLLRATDGSECILVGESADVEEVLEIYAVEQLRLLTQSNTEWLECRNGALAECITDEYRVFDYDGDYENPLTVDGLDPKELADLEALHQRIYLACAVGRMHEKRLPKPDPNKQVVQTQETGRQPTKVKAEDAAPPVINTEREQVVLRSAKYKGIEHGNVISFQAPRSLKRIMAKSTFPPPPASSRTDTLHLPRS